MLRILNPSVNDVGESERTPFYHYFAPIGQRSLRFLFCRKICSSSTIESQTLCSGHFVSVFARRREREKEKTVSHFQEIRFRYPLIYRQCIVVDRILRMFNLKTGNHSKLIGRWGFSSTNTCTLRHSCSFKYMRTRRNLVGSANGGTLDELN